MKSINLAAGTTHVPFGDLAQKIADAMWPGDDHFKRECARGDLADELARAVDAGLFHGLGGKPLPVKNPLTLGPHTFPVGAALQTALVTVNDFRAYVADLGIEVTVENTVSQSPAKVCMHDSDIEAGLRKLPPKEAARWENANVKDGGKRYITSQYAELGGGCLMTLEQFCDEVGKRLLRWRKGRYLVCEAAQVVADANPGDDVESGIDAEVHCKQMKDAIHANKLTVRLNGIPVAADSITPFRLHLHTVLQSDVNKWLQSTKAGYALDYPYQTTAADSQAAPLVTEGASGGVEPIKAGPLPLTTGDIAFCFAGLRWDEQQWKKPLGDKPKWLLACVAIPGVRGVSETRWNPVDIGAALVRDGRVRANSVRARFHAMPTLKPWFDAWKTYEDDYINKL